MSDESRIQQLLEETLDSSRPPEEVCAEFPELLWEVRERLRRCQNVEAQINAIFPPSNPATAARRRRVLSAEDPLPQIPGYLVEEVLGRGGVGVVYKARHLKLNRYVALKMLLSGIYADPHELARFTHEAEAVASLRHANIVQVHDIGDLDGMPYFTMEFIDSGSLAQKLAGVPQTAVYAASLLATLATAVQVAHQGGIIHRDLKPSNILLSSDGTPKITDFGLARRIDGDSAITQSGARVGTPSYMAPEQALGNMSAIGPPTDIYALGAILYEMLTGRPPFRAESATETERQLISNDPVPPSRLNAKVPRDLETICLKCLSKEPERRYASAEALADDLRRFLEGRPIVARPLGWAGRVWRWIRREPTAAALVATALALVGLVVGSGFWIERQQGNVRAAESRQVQAVEAALKQAAGLEKLGHWPEALRALEGAPGLLSTSAPAKLRDQLHRARADAEMVVRLEDVRLRLSEGTEVLGKSSPTADHLYTDAFKNYGITLTDMAPADAAARVRGSDIRDMLLVFLHDWLYWVTEASRASLRALVEAADDDPWRRMFREARAKNDIAKLEELSSAPQALDQPPALLSGLGGTILADGHRAQAWVLLHAAQQRYPGDFWINYLIGHYLEQERPLEAVGYFRAAVAIRPGSNQAYNLLGRALHAAGDPDAAGAAFREAASLNSSRADIVEMIKVLAPKGRLEEVRVAWEKMLARDPPDHDRWYGYAQLCLYLGNQDAYRQTRSAMLRRFGESDDWIVAERTSLASLLLPDSVEELRMASALADRAVANASKSPEPNNPYVQFAKGLSEYRQGRLEQAVPSLRDAVLKLPNRPGPQLVMAMTQFRSGSSQQARKSLAAAVTVYNWMVSHDDHSTAWTNHVLRREAETLILPDLPAFLQGKYKPRDNDERLALQGICQFRGLYGVAAQLYSDAFTSEPDLADRMTAECRERAVREGDPAENLNAEARFLAARCAAMAACGLGEDGPKLTETERARWREQSRLWLAADLAAWAKTLNDGPETSRDLSRKMFALWQADPDLAAFREPQALGKLPEEERGKWIALWKQIGDGVTRIQRPNP